MLEHPQSQISNLTLQPQQHQPIRKKSVFLTHDTPFTFMGSTTPPTEDTAYRIKHPLEETEAPVINPCVPNQEVQVIPYNGDLPKTQKVDIISRTTQCAYYIIPSKPGKSLNHHAPGWGFVYFAIVLFQVSEGLYQEPEPCLLYTSPSPRDRQKSRMPSSA